jgi:Flp pilus assembly protein TadD
MNQLRIGEMEEGQRNVERAFKGDPRNVWLFNTLELTDTFDRFRTVRTSRFELFMEGREAQLLEPYVLMFADEAFEALKARYGVEPPTPIRIEIYPSHGDFSVRTLGLVGLGALGVSFGNVLVMDSPSARQAGEFNWASTLWHELAHAFHLSMTDFRVPRWFSEGLAVHEQRLARPNWGFRAGVGFLQAYQQGRLNPVSDLNRGFVRPEYPEQVLHSYLQSSLVFAMIESQQGLGAILAMMRGYREGKSTDQLVREVLRTTPEALDAAFDDYFRARFETPLAAISPTTEPPPFGTSVEQLRTLVAQRPGDFLSRLSLGRALLDQGDLEGAEQQMRTALTLFPEYGGPDNPYLYLARIHRERGDLLRAADALRAAADRDESAHSILVEEATLRRELGDTVGELRALGRAVEVYPYDLQAHVRLAGLFTAQGDGPGAVRERLAVLALGPTDRAGAHLALAEAYVLAGNPAAARTQLLRALEIAPAYPAAQELLLRLRGGP